MAVTLDTALVSAFAQKIGKAHIAYQASVGGEGRQESATFWVEDAKSRLRGGNDTTTGITSGCAVTAQGTPTNTVAVAAGSVDIGGVTVAVGANAAFGGASTFPLAGMDGAALTAGVFYDASLCVNTQGVLVAFFGPRDDRDDAVTQVPIPSGWCQLARIRVRYQAGGTSLIQSADITVPASYTQYAAQTADAAIRLFTGMDTIQQRILSRAAVKNEMVSALTLIDNYVYSVTSAQGLNGGAGYKTTAAWATATQTQLPDEFRAFYRGVKGKDPSTLLGTLLFTASGAATWTDNKKSIAPDTFQIVTLAATGAAASTVTITVNQAGSTNALAFTGTVPASSASGTVITMTAAASPGAASGVVKGNVLYGKLSGNALYETLPANTVTEIQFMSVASVAVTGGTSGDNLLIRNVGG